MQRFSSEKCIVIAQITQYVIPIILMHRNKIYNIFITSFMEKKLMFLEKTIIHRLKIRKK